MGITIHYQGKAKSLQAIDELIAVMREFAITSKWSYHLVDEEMKGKFSPSWGHGYGYIPNQEEIQKRGLEFFPKMVIREHSGYYKLYDSPYKEEVRKAFRKGRYPEFTIDTRKKGIQLEIHPKCEWLEFIFDLKTLELANYDKYDHTPGMIFGYNGLFCKTQFAGPRVHMIVCKLLKVAEQYIEFTSIRDEGDYYHTQDLTALIHAFGESTKMLESLGKMLKEIGEKNGMTVVMGGEENK